MPARWQTELADAIRDPAELLRLLELDPALASGGASQQFPLRVPRGFVARMCKRDPADPLLRQVLATGMELDEVPGFLSDPVADLASRRHPGVLHKYRGRVLLIASGVCGVHCRYCFRRHFPYQDETAGTHAWRETLDYLRADGSINEVILSGGDPLSLNDRQLAGLVVSLQAIPHIRRLRIHTRQPVVLPSRVDEALLAWLGACTLQKIVVLHVNHARELDAEVADACAKLRGTGALLFNQSVLLRGVNDSVATLAELSEALCAAGVMPYYLNLLDRVRGAAHFEVPEDEARRLMRDLRARLPGYLMPRLVREVPGSAAKQPIPDAAEDPPPRA